MNLSETAFVVPAKLSSTLNIQDILIIISLILDETDNISDLELWASDLDYNNLINVQDIVLTVNMILGAMDQSSAADINQDGIINVLDVILLINTILGSN